MVLAAGGGAYALANSLGKHSATQPPSQPSTGSTTPRAHHAGGRHYAGRRRLVVGRGSEQAGSPAPSPTLSLVAIGQGVTSSAAEPQVETLLSHYFHGINTRDYAEYASTLNPAQQAKQSQSTFESGYSTTTDSGMTLTSLASGGAAGLVATVTFTSHQSPAQSVDHSACNAWTLTLLPGTAGHGLPDRSRTARLPAEPLRLLTCGPWSFRLPRGGSRLPLASCSCSPDGSP